MYDGRLYEFGEKLGKILAKRGLLHIRKGDYSSAFADFDEAIRLDSNNFAAFEGRAKVYRAFGENTKADADETTAKCLREAQTRKTAEIK